MYGIKVPDDSTVTFCREIKFKMRFGVTASEGVCLQVIDVKDLKFTACQLMYTFMKVGG